MALARYDDPRSGIKAGDELGVGIQQKEYLNKNKLPTYTTYAGQETPIVSKTFEEAVVARETLLKKAGGLKTTAVPTKNTWENLTKDPLYKTFFKEQVKVNDNIKKAMKANNVTEASPLKKIFEALRSEVSKAKKGVPSPAGVGVNVLDNLNRTFENTFKVQRQFAGTITPTELVSKLDESGVKTTTQMINLYLRYGKPTYTPKKYPVGSKMYLMENNRIKAGKEFVKTLDDLGIKAEVVKGHGKYAMDRPSRAGLGKTTRKNIEGAAGGKNRFTISKPQLKKLATSTFFTESEPVYRMLDDFSSQSRASDEYKLNKYKIDNENIRRLTRNMNNTVAAMSDRQLRNFVNKNPKLKNLVETTFNPAKGEFLKIPLNEIPNQSLREKMRFETDHIRGRETVKYDQATKKILDGLDIEYPRNLYIVPNAVNNSTKKLVENYVEAFPNETKKIKKIDKFFKDNGLTYWDKRNGQYRGATPKITNTDLSHLGLTTDEVLLSKKVNPKTGELVIEGGQRLVERIGERNTFLFNIFKQGTPKEQYAIATTLKCVPGNADGGRIGYALGTGAVNCVQTKLATETEIPKLTQLDDSSPGLTKMKNAATGFLGFAKKGGKFGAIAAGGAAAAGLVKTFMNDDPTTYLSNEDQQKNMLIEMVTGPMVDKPDPTPEILDYQLPVLGATTAAGTAVTGPSTIEAARSSRFGKKPSGYTKTALKTLGRGLAASGTPLGLAALEPLHIAGQVQAGDSLGEIATNPWNYAGLAFADDLSKFATKGLGANVAKAMRLGISPAALRVGSRFLGMPGLALSLGISGYEMYDDYKKKRGWFSEE